MVAERPRVLLTNRAWMHPDDVPNGLYDAFYYETTEQVQDDEGIWVKQVKPIDLVADSAKGYVGFPRGDLMKLRRWLPQARFIDQRQIAPLGFDLELDVDKLSADQRWTDQEDMIERWYQAAGGVLVAPPGSGKSIVGVGMTCRVGLRTLFLFDRKDFRDHWLREFHQFTNLGERNYTVAVTDVSGHKNHLYHSQSNARSETREIASDAPMRSSISGGNRQSAFFSQRVGSCGSSASTAPGSPPSPTRRSPANATGGSSPSRPDCISGPGRVSTTASPAPPTAARRCWRSCAGSRARRS